MCFFSYNKIKIIIINECTILFSLKKKKCPERGPILSLKKKGKVGGEAQKIYIGYWYSYKQLYRLFVGYCYSYIYIYIYICSACLENNNNFQKITCTTNKMESLFGKEKVKKFLVQSLCFTYVLHSRRQLHGNNNNFQKIK